MRNSFLLILFFATGITACSKPEISREPQSVMLVAPAYFPAIPTSASNPFTLEGIELGRLLFYDKRLSGTNQLSCGSCHKQDLAFSDGVALSSIGASGLTLHRNAPALFNLAWSNNGLFWDGGSTNLESQAFAPLSSPDEMNQELFELVSELKAIPDYVNRFRFVFKDNEITTGYIVRALAQFQRSFISAGSRYDRYRRHEAAGSLTTQEQEGMLLVQSKCSGCHQGELFTDNDYHNNGIDADFSDRSFESVFQGRFRITGNPADIGKFRTPTLRNIMLTAPYMHDGRFTHIEQVLDHYSKGVLNSATLDPLVMQNAGAAGIPLNDVKKQAIIAFLNTLTDSSFIKNPQFSKP